MMDVPQRRPSVNLWADFAACAILISLGMFQFLSIQRAETYWMDGSAYMGLAESIAHHGKYVFNFKAFTWFPPGFPVLLAIVGKLWNFRFDVFIRLVVLCGTLGLIAFFWLIRAKAGTIVAAASTIILATSPQFYSAATRYVGSDLPFILFSVMCLIMIEKLRSMEQDRKRFLLSLVLGPLLAWSVLIRSAGLALLVGLAGWLAYMFFLKKKQAILKLRSFSPAVAFCLLAQLAWIGWCQNNYSPTWKGGIYDDIYYRNLILKNGQNPELGKASVFDFVSRTGKGIIGIISWADAVVLRTRIQTIWYPQLVILPLLIIGVGVIRSIRKEEITPWYFVVYLGITSVWPFDLGIRFLFPVFPLLLLYFWEGARWVVEYLSKQPRKFACLSCAIALGLIPLSIFISRHSATKSIYSLVISLAFWGMWCLLSLLAALPFFRHIITNIDKRDKLLVLYPRALGFAKWLALGAGILGATILIWTGLKGQIALARENILRDTRWVAERDGLVQAAEWIKANVAPTEIIMASRDSDLHRLTGLRVVVFPATSDPLILIEALRKNKIGILVIIDSPLTSWIPTAQQRLDLIQKQRPACLTPLRIEKMYRIFRVSREPPDGK